MLQQQTQSPGWRVLNRDVIKYIAITAMLLNHIANFFWCRAPSGTRCWWISATLPPLPCAIFW